MIIGVQWHSRRAVVEVSAGTGIHRRHQHEARRKAQRHGRPRDGHVAVFQRLAHHFQHIAGELGKLVEEQHAVVGQRHFARPRESCLRRSALRRRSCGGASGMAACRQARWPHRAPRRRCGSSSSPALRRRSAAAGSWPCAWQAWSCLIPEGRSSAGCGRPAAATSMARLAVCWPRTSRKSTVNCCDESSSARVSTFIGWMPLPVFSKFTTSMSERTGYTSRPPPRRLRAH